MKYSNQKWFCTNCGKEQFSSPMAGYGKHGHHCSIECVHEMNWKEVLSIMNSEYYPQPETKKEENEE